MLVICSNYFSESDSMVILNAPENESEEDPGNNLYYYMASSVSGQDEPNPAL